MNLGPLVQVPETVHHEIVRHLLREPNGDEQAAFMFARYNADENEFRFLEWSAVPPDGFVVQLPYHFELTDFTRAATIKRAHDLDASIIEFHSHTGPWPTKFSASDWSGLEEVVPHVWWRLKGRPYAAVVVARNGFDGLVWLHDPNTPERLGGIAVETGVLQPTRLSPLARDEYDWTL